MTAFLLPGIHTVERLRMSWSLFLIASLYFAAQVLSVWTVTGAGAWLSEPLNDATRVAGMHGMELWGAAVLFVTATYLLASLVMATRANLEKLSQALDRIADGEIATQTISDRAADESSEAGRLWHTLAQMRTDLGKIVTQVRSSAETIALGAREIADGHANLSQRTEKQASTLEEIAAGMEELAGTVQQNAAHCKSAADLSQSALATANRGAEAVHRAMHSMSAIEESSRRMADITGVIQGIAFQTNILALNAAVEAARAGDHGRGFGVVASEVRSLAHRSADAAKEIKALIGQSVEQIAEGGRDASAAGKRIDDIVVSVEKVSRLIGEVTTASGEQSAGVGEVNKAIMQLEGVTQQNAALVEEAAASTLHFQDEAARLLEVVGAFKLDRMESRDQAVALVRKAAAHLAAVGPERAFDDFEDPRAGFVFGDLYIYAYDMNGIRQASGGMLGTRGKDISNDLDAYGKRYGQALVDLARDRGRGWVDYCILNPVTQHAEPKSSYIERVGDYFVGSGIYRPEAERGPARAQPVLAAARHVSTRARLPA